MGNNEYNMTYDTLLLGQCKKCSFENQNSRVKNLKPPLKKQKKPLPQKMIHLTAQTFMGIWQIAQRTLQFLRNVCSV